MKVYYRIKLIWVLKITTKLVSHSLYMNMYIVQPESLSATHDYFGIFTHQMENLPAFGTCTTKHSILSDDYFFLLWIV